MSCGPQRKGSVQSHDHHLQSHDHHSPFLQVQPLSKPVSVASSPIAIFIHPPTSDSTTLHTSTTHSSITTNGVPGAPATPGALSTPGAPSIPTVPPTPGAPATPGVQDTHNGLTAEVLVVGKAAANEGPLPSGHVIKQLAVHSNSSYEDSMPVTTLTHSRTIVSTPLSSSGSLIGAQTSSAGSQTPQVGSTHAIAEMVTLNEFADAFLKGDVTNWYPRMALLDHIEAVQKKMAAWMDEVEQQLEGKGEKSSVN